jgi:hypothetical protein
MKMQTSTFRLLRLFLLLLFGQTLLMSGVHAQTTYETATYLCNTNSSYVLNTPASDELAQSGPNYGCNSGAVNALWYRFQISSGTRLHWQLLPLNNSNLDFVLWGPFANPDPGTAALNASNIRYCTNSPILIENIDVSPVSVGSYYILAVFNADRTPGSFSFVPQTGNNVVLGSSIVSAPINPSTIAACTPPFNIQTFPSSGNITNVSFSGNGITNSTTGTFDPSVAGVGTHNITITGSPYGCAPRAAIYTITVSNCPFTPTISNPSGQNVICWNAFLPPITAVSPTYPSGVSHVAWQWEYRLLGSNTWQVYPIVPDNPLANFVVTGSLEIRVRDILSNGVSVTSAALPFTVLNPIQVPIVNLVSGSSTLCNGAPLSLSATAANGGGNNFQYEWERKIGSGAWTRISPASASTTLNLSSVTESAQYRIIATDVSIRQCGSVISDPISITVQDAVTQGQIGSNATPVQIDVCMDDAALLTSVTAASGTAGATLTYQWWVSTNNVSWSPISGSNSADYTAPALTVPGRRFYRRQATYTLNGVSCPSTAEYSNVVSVTWVDDFPYVSASRLHQFDGPFAHNWPVASAASTISGATATDVTLTTPASTSSVSSVSAFYRLSNNIVPFDGIVSFNAQIEYFHPVCGGPNAPGSWESTPPTTASNLQKSFEVSGIPSDLGNGGLFSFRVRQGESIGFTIGLTGSQVSPGNCYGHRIRLRITGFSYHRRGANGSVTLCENQPHTVPNAIVSDNPAAGFAWTIVSGSGTLSSSTAINPVYTPGPSDVGTTVILSLVATRTSGVCSTRSSGVVYDISYRPTFVPASVVAGQDRIRCYNGVGDVFTATAASGGSGPYAYQWQSSTNGGAWINIQGATSLVYNALSPLTENTCYRIVSSDVGTPSCATAIVSSNSVCVSIRRPLTAPIISNPSPILVCPTDSAILESSVLATGGNGVFKYTWEVVNASSALPAGQPHLWPWSSVLGATLLDPPASGPLSFTTAAMYCGADRWYRLVAQDQNVIDRAGCGTAWSLPVLVRAFDVTPPVIVPKLNQQLYVAGNCSTTVTDVLGLVNSWSDNCTYQQLWDWKITPSTFGVGPQTAVITAKDTCGNIGTAFINLLVLDTIRPFAQARNLIVNLGSNGTATASAILADSLSTDNCSIVSRQLIPATFGCNDIGTNPVIFRVTDASGNTADANILVTVLDVTAPVFQGCPSDVTLVGYNNGTGSTCVAGYTWSVPTVIDNCDNNVTVTASHAPCSVFPQGNTTVTYTATDDYGNSSTCSFVVTVLPATGGCAPTNPAANPTIEITNVQGNCIGGTLTADLRLSRYSGRLGAISMYLDYNGSVLANPTLTYTNPLLVGSDDNNAGAGDYRLAWNWNGTGSAPYVCDNAILYTIRFDIISGGNSNIEFDLSQSINCELANESYTVIPSVVFRGIQPSPITMIPCNGFSGTLTYDNTSSSPIANTMIHLVDGSNNVVSSGVTGANGAYHLPGSGLVVGQSYSVKYMNPNAWRNAVNATDALGIQRHVVSLGTPLSGLALQAADVNSSTTVTSADAALVRRRYTSLIDTFSPNVDWVYNVSSMTYSGGLATMNIKTLNMGDVNKSRPSVQRSGYSGLPEAGVLVADGSGYRADFVSLEGAQLGAVSIELLLPIGAVVSDVKLFNGVEGIVWHQTGTELFVAWSDLAGVSVESNSVLMSIYFENKPTGAFMSSINTEFANLWADPIHGFRFGAPVLSTIEKTTAIQIYPNPSQGMVKFTADVDYVQVTDLQGRIILENAAKTITSLDLSALPKGVYLVVLRKGEYIAQHKVVLKD